MVGCIHNNNKTRDYEMNLSAPTKIVFLISFVLAALALLAAMGVAIPVVSGNAMWVALLAYIILAAGNLMNGM